MPCSRTILAMEAVVTMVTVYGCERWVKWAFFVNRSTTSMTTMKPPEDSKLLTKFIYTSDQTRSGMGSGWSNLAGNMLSDLFCWPMSQWRTNSMIVWCIPGTYSHRGGATRFFGIRSAPWLERNDIPRESEESIGKSGWEEHCREKRRPHHVEWHLA